MPAKAASTASARRTSGRPSTGTQALPSAVVTYS